MRMRRHSYEWAAAFADHACVRPSCESARMVVARNHLPVLRLTTWLDKGLLHGTHMPRE
jgi:hypothetical protein